MPRAVKIVVAPDKFKGSLSAAEAAEAVRAGVLEAHPDAEVVLTPVADGGEGTVDAAVSAGFEALEAVVTGPTGEPVTATFALRGDTAVVEMAEASGLRRLPGGRPAPLTASTFGTGELVRAALDAGARRLVLGIGGSATTDGGSGLAAALGVRFLDGSGNPLAPGGAALAGLSTLDLTGADPRLAGLDVVVATDVDNPLLGSEGAATVYGPQKGASPEDIQRLEAGLTRFADVVRGSLGVELADLPGAGAAGGLGGGAVAFLGARLESGIDYLLGLVGFREALPGATLVVTGEGSFDAQSLRGKAAQGVARAAGAAGVPVVVLAGRVDVPPETAAAAGFGSVRALTELEPDLERCQREAGPLLRRLAYRMAAALSP